jgi:ubiquinone/menaquinone biosynthesis C-methylase UbiE
VKRLNHTDHVNLIRDGVADANGIWADFGSGAGAFTLALAELLGGSGQIYSIDRDSGALEQQRKAMRAQFPNQTVTYHAADFTRPLDLAPATALDGILMANSLHFIRDKAPVLALVRGYLKPGGSLLLVEYNTNQGNTWVPYPFTYETWEEMAGKNGFRDTRKLAARPSRFLGEIFSALSVKG